MQIFCRRQTRLRRDSLLRLSTFAPIATADMSTFRRWRTASQRYPTTTEKLSVYSNLTRSFFPQQFSTRSGRIGHSRKEAALEIQRHVHQSDQRRHFREGSDHRREGCAVVDAEYSHGYGNCQLNIVAGRREEECRRPGVARAGLPRLRALHLLSLPFMASIPEHIEPTPRPRAAFPPAQKPLPAELNPLEFGGLHRLAFVHPLHGQPIAPAGRLRATRYRAFRSNTNDLTKLT